MTTFSDDFIQFDLPALGESIRLPLQPLEIEWPPPPKLRVAGVRFVRHSMSEITDEQRSAMTHVCRGALYRPETPLDRWSLALFGPS